MPARVCRDTAVILEEQSAAYGVSAAILQNDAQPQLV